MRILYVSTISNTVNRFLIPHIEMLKGQGHSVDIACNIIQKIPPMLFNRGTEVFNLEFKRTPYAKENYQAYKKILNILRMKNYDIVHVHTPVAAAYARLACKRFKNVKVIYTAHGFHFYKGAPIKNWLIYFPIENWLSRYTDLLITMNAEDYKRAKKSFKAKRVEYISGVGVDITEFNRELPTISMSSIKKELRIESDSKIISCIAELSTRKNQFFLLNNWKEILSENPNTYLLLVGEGEDYEKILKYIKREELRNVHLLGYRKDVADIITASDIITLTSKHEGLPVCLMEAMACGKPIVTTNVRGSRDLVINNENGIIVELNDNKALIESFTILLKDQRMRKDFGKHGINKISKYSLENVLKEMEPIYNFYLK